eukprot:m.42845 g.42845  ORF g.42845 m.42845 type:complete len:1292 (+) comp9918_c0_seq1:194-4069(+)
MSLTVSLEKPLGFGFDGFPNTGCFVTKVNPDGNAAKSGKIKTGLKVSKVNNSSTAGLAKKQVTALIKSGPSPCELVFETDPEGVHKYKEYKKKLKQEASPSTTVHLELSSPLGIEFDGNPRVGCFVTNVKPTGSAHESGKVKRGMRILNVNGKDVRIFEKEAITSLIQSTIGKCKLSLEVDKPGFDHFQTELRASTQDDVLSQSSLPSPGGIFKVTMKTPLGMKCHGTPELGAYITLVKENSNSYGKLERGWRVMSVNGTSTEHMSGTEAVALVKTGGETCIMEVKNDKKGFQNYLKHMEQEVPPPVPARSLQPTEANTQAPIPVVVQDTPKSKPPQTMGTSALDPWKLVESAPAIDTASEKKRGKRDGAAAHWNHGINAAMVLGALSKKNVSSSAPTEEKEFEKSFTTTELLFSDHGNDQVRRRLRIWSFVALGLGLIMIGLAATCCGIGSRLAYSYPSTTTLTVDNVGNRLLDSNCSAVSPSCCRDCATEQECDECVENTVLSLQCCPREGTMIEEDQEWLFTGTVVAALVTASATVIFLWYLLFASYDFGKWEDIHGASTRSSFEELCVHMRSQMIGDVVLTRKIRRETRVNSNLQVEMTEKLLDHNSLLIPERGDVLQRKTLDKPKRVYLAVFFLFLTTILLYIILMYAFVAVRTDTECFDCEYRAAWYAARDATIKDTTELKALAIAEFFVGLLLAFLVYLITPIQYGKSREALDHWAPPQPIAINKVLSSLPSPATEKAMEAPILSEKKFEKITKPTVISINPKLEGLGMRIVNLGKGNIIASTQSLGDVPDLLGLRVCSINDDDVRYSSLKTCEEKLKEAEGKSSVVYLLAPMGVTVPPYPAGTHAIISAVKPGGNAANSEQVEAGMTLLSLAGRNTTELTHMEIIRILRSAVEVPVSLKLAKPINVTVAPREFYPFEILTDSKLQKQSISDQNKDEIFGFAPTVEPPTISLDQQNRIIIESKTVGASLYYTMDGSDPDPGVSTTTFWYGAYVPSLNMTVGHTCHVRAIGRKQGMDDSSISENHFEVEACDPCEVTLNPSVDDNFSAYHFMSVQLSCTSQDSSIRYKIYMGRNADEVLPDPTDATIPYDASSPPHIPVDEYENVSIIAVADLQGKAPSAVVQEFKFSRTGKPSITQSISGSLVTFDITPQNDGDEIFFLIGSRVGSGDKASDMEIPSLTSPNLAEKLPNEANSAYLPYDATAKAVATMEKAGGLPIQAVARSIGGSYSDVAFDVAYFSQCNPVQISPTTHEELISVEHNHTVRITSSDSDINFVHHKWNGPKSK